MYRSSCFRLMFTSCKCIYVKSRNLRLRNRKLAETRQKLFPLDGKMQVVNSVLIHKGDSLALSDILRVSTVERVGNDVNEDERKKAFRIGFSVVILMSVIMGIFFYNHSSSYSGTEINIGLFLILIFSGLLISLQAKSSFPVLKDNEYGVKVSFDGGSAVLFWHKNQSFSNKVAKSLKEAVVKEASMGLNWFVDFNYQATKMCRRNSLRDPITLLIERAKNQATYRV